MIIIVVSPLRGGWYAAHFEDQLLCWAREPFFASARKLLARGIDPDAEIGMVHSGETVVSLTSTVGVAAKLTVHETDTEGPYLARYRPPPPSVASLPCGGTPISAEDEYEAAGVA